MSNVLQVAADITNLQAELDAKWNTSSFGAVGLTLAGTNSAESARATLGAIRGQSKSITIPNPTASESLTLFCANQAFTITKIVTVLRGVSNPQVAWTIRKGSARNSIGTEVITGGSITTSTTVGNSLSIFTDAALSTNDWCWFETSSINGSVNEFHLTIFMDIA